VALKHYRELIAWQKAMDLVTVVYETTSSFPNREMFGLTNQLRRAAVSVPSNIAEGQARQTTKEFLHFLSIAIGSLQEVETQMIIASRLDYLEETKVGRVLEASGEVSRLICGLRNSPRSRLP
jgi:four helix bundle protein